MLTGSIYITNDYQVLMNAPRESIIINLDEDHKLSEMFPNAIEGYVLLPPVEAKIAEIDGDECKYNSIYLQHLYAQQDFMSAIIAFLYKDGNMIMYLPDEYNYTKEKLCGFIFQVYGIHIGDLQNPSNSQCFYNMHFLPFWLNILFDRDLISWLDWIRLMPLDAYDNNKVLGGNPETFYKAVSCMSPYVEKNQTMEESIREFVKFHKLSHQNPKLIPAISYIAR